MRKRFGQGRRPFHATLAVGVAMSLAGCGTEEPVPAQMSRPVYATQEACLQDWGAPECSVEEGAQPQDADKSGAGSAGSGVRYYGPFMHNGFYYPAAGGYRRLQSAPRHAAGVVAMPPSRQATQAFHSRSAVTRGGLGTSASSHFSGG